jgi:hypothetical protein
METTSIKWKRFSLALVVGSAVSAQIMAMLHYWNGPHGLTLEVLPYTPLLALTYLLFLMPTAFIVGVPVAIVLDRTGLLRGWVVVLIGTLAGAAWAIPAIGYKPPPYDMAVFFGFGGFLASALFWLVYAGANKAN